MPRPNRDRTRLRHTTSASASPTRARYEYTRWSVTTRPPTDKGGMPKIPTPAPNSGTVAITVWMISSTAREPNAR